MKHHALHLLWPCMNKCSYCWVEQTVRTRPEQFHVKVRPLADWIAACNRDLQGGIGEILGGEPLMIPWVPELIAACPNVRFGLSTNGIRADRAEELARRRLPNLISVNLSLHPESPEWEPNYLEMWERSITAFRSAYPLMINLVDAPGNREKCVEIEKWAKARGIHFSVNPYEISADLHLLRKEGLICRGGIDHLLVAPDGECWPCFTATRSPYWKEYSLGNWLDDTVDETRKPAPCHLNCVDYYVLAKEHEAGDMWGVNARPATKEGGWWHAPPEFGPAMGQVYHDTPWLKADRIAYWMQRFNEVCPAPCR